MERTKTKAEVEDELQDANDYIEQLEGKLNDIVGIASDEEDDADSDEEEEDDSDDSDDEEGDDTLD